MNTNFVAEADWERLGGMLTTAIQDKIGRAHV